MGRIWESINASNQHMLTHVPNGQIASSPLCGEFEFSKEVIVFGKRTLTLKNLNENSRLVVNSSGEAAAHLTHSQIDSNRNLHLALPCGDDRVTGDQLCEDTA